MTPYEGLGPRGHQWCGADGSQSPHRTAGASRAWCLGCAEWCYRGPALRCRCCDAVSDDPPVVVRRSDLLRWASTIDDNMGLDAVAAELDAVAADMRSRMTSDA